MTASADPTGPLALAAVAARGDLAAAAEAVVAHLRASAAVVSVHLVFRGVDAPRVVGDPVPDPEQLLEATAGVQADPTAVGLPAGPPAVLIPVAGETAPVGMLAATGADPDLERLRAATAVLAAVHARHAAVVDLGRAVARLEDAQALAHIGSYDWDMRTDVNRWSDELYRIYGCEPQSFNASYERFIGFVHPDDRDRIRTVHEQSFATGEPFETIERIVRPSGEIRVLSTTGQVIHDVDGTPVRVAGVCADITERYLAEETAARTHQRFEALVEAAPDAVFLLDVDGTIRHVNAEGEQLTGRTRDDLVGRRALDLVPPPYQARLAALGREDTTSERRSEIETALARPDGSEVPVDVNLGLFEAADGPVVVAFVRDATERRQRAEAVMRRHDEELRRRQALEINDNVLQGLTSITYALERGDLDVARTATAGTLAAARSMVDNLLAGSEAGVAAGALVRERPVTNVIGAAGAVAEEPPAAAEDARRVVIADDSEDLRLLLRVAFNKASDFEVVGEAGDGAAAVAAAREHAPDVVLLDLAMPVMDGLEALPQIRAAAPQALIVILSGFAADSMGVSAEAAGADDYVEKGLPPRELLDHLRDLLAARVG
jgi:PAS domain S-box-containing protein